MLTLTINIEPSKNTIKDFSREDLDHLAVSTANAVRELISSRLRAQGGRRFWSHAADAVRRVSQGSTQIIQVQQRGIRLQWLGGTVTPKHAKLLAIPASKSISEYPRAYSNLQFIPMPPHKFPHLRGLLVTTTTSQLIFRLVDSSHHSPHPHILPSPTELSQSVADTTSRFILNFKKQ